jgi:hypothetical protein
MTRDNLKQITAYQLHLLRHTLGNKTNYRNHFNADKGHSDYADLEDLTQKGFMEKTVVSLTPGDVFVATDKGKDTAWSIL